MHNFFCVLVPLLALFLDARFADPRNIPHPVRLIGKAYGFLENPARSFGHERLAGVLCVLAVSGGAWLPVRFLIGLPFVGCFIALYLCFAGLAMGTLLREAGAALKAVESEDPERARLAVSMLVSRDTARLDKNELCRALAESVSENFNDALVAPFFWLLAGGPAGLWAYKAVSTADSMWGYMTPKWRDLGWAGARLDDLLAWIPARLSAFFLLAGSYAAHCPGSFPGWRVIAGQAKSMKSPNSGWPMAMAAWLHDTRMGGPTVYFGELVQKPVLGPDKRSGGVPGAEGGNFDAGNSDTRSPSGTDGFDAEISNTRGVCAESPDAAAPCAGYPKNDEAVAWTPDAVRLLMRHVRVSGLIGCTCLWLFFAIAAYLF